MQGTSDQQERTKQIIELFKESKEDLSITQVAEKMGTSRSTVSITLETLVGIGILKRTRRIGKAWLYAISDEQREE